MISLVSNTPTKSTLYQSNVLRLIMKQKLRDYLGYKVETRVKFVKSDVSMVSITCFECLSVFRYPTELMPAFLI